MPKVETDLGREFSASEAVAFIREQSERMLDPNLSQTESNHAATELLYTVRSLDYFLCTGGQLPDQWHAAGVAFSDARV